MDDFPPISKEDNPEVLIYYADKYFRDTRKLINLNTIPETAGCTPLRVAKKRKGKKYASDDTVEPKPKKQKESKKVLKLEDAAQPSLPTIQEEIVELEPTQILPKRTKG